jgi:hypothetical protein
MEPERVFVFGASGSGKTTLAAEIGARLSAPVHELDLLARVGGGNGPERTAEERQLGIDSILATPRWVAEGVHLDWAGRLLDAADVILWLDHLAFAGSSSRQVRRFVRQAFGEARRQRGIRRFLRVRDYGRHLRELAAAIGESRRYHSSREPGDGGSRALDHAAASQALAHYGSKVIRCRSTADVRRFVGQLEGYA